MFFITKYAATKGIINLDTGVEFEQLDGSTTVEDLDGKSFVVGKSAFRTLDDARVDAIKRTRKKISLLVKKEAKLESAITTWETELFL